mmetsp:Transcript_66302/g.158618  ORF Transcript_66302/g.158618 Transcript_66302/m.158618 type:complete len:311 (+) Transcript_66302:33-965(+)
MGNSALSATGYSTTGAAEGLTDHLAEFDIIRDDRQTETRRYEAFVPQEVRIRFLASGFGMALAVLVPATLPRLVNPTFTPSLTVVIGTIILSLSIWGLYYLAQTFKWIVREGDTLVFETILCRHKVQLGDVVELVVLRNGTHFRQLMRRWGVMPFGPKMHIFLGAPSNHDAMVVLLTRGCFWSYIFCLQDPVRFLLDNQRPLDLQATYRVAIKAVLREGESLESQQLGAIDRGSRVRVEEQRGRRVRVRTDNDISGWISYISHKGWFILLKERKQGESAGVIGASELARSGDGAAEFGLLLPANRPGSLE